MFLIVIIALGQYFEDFDMSLYSCRKRDRKRHGRFIFKRFFFYFFGLSFWCSLYGCPDFLLILVEYESPLPVIVSRVPAEFSKAMGVKIQL